MRETCGSDEAWRLGSALRTASEDLRIVRTTMGHEEVSVLCARLRRELNEYRQSYPCSQDLIDDVLRLLEPGRVDDLACQGIRELV